MDDEDQLIANQIYEADRAYEEGLEAAITRSRARRQIESDSDSSLSLPLDDIWNYNPQELAMDIEDTPESELSIGSCIIVTSH